MDWTQIIVAAFGALGGVGLGRLLFFRANGRKAEAEATGAQLAVLEKALESLNAQLDKYGGLIAEKNALIEKQNSEITHLTSRLTALYDDMCVHKGCRLRKPHTGQGKLWYDQNADDPSLGCDYMSIDTLIKKDRAKRLAENILMKEQIEEAEE